MSFPYIFFGFPLTIRDVSEDLKMSGRDRDVQVIVEAREYTGRSFRPYVLLDNDKRFYFSGVFPNIDKVDSVIRRLKKRGVSARVKVVE